ncbi:hypothetical protein PR048_017119 [Dryococelus australis]|uniref:Uncharacterized protein n=1 Tax=Dryococelus australis TaxID=614101 RepID=A0ABQ9H8Q3_9NEOP|nr:hypothetical protein PR048_017119 [Dryococelus australis]
MDSPLFASKSSRYGKLVSIATPEYFISQIFLELNTEEKTDIAAASLNLALRGDISSLSVASEEGFTHASLAVGNRLGPDEFISTTSPAIPPNLATKSLSSKELIAPLKERGNETSRLTKEDAPSQRRGPPWTSRELEPNINRREKIYPRRISTQRNRLRFTLFARGNRAGRCRWSAGFLGISRFSHPCIPMLLRPHLAPPDRRNRESNPGPPECELPLRHFAEFFMSWLSLQSTFLMHFSDSPIRRRRRNELKAALAPRGRPAGSNVIWKPTAQKSVKTAQVGQVIRALVSEASCPRSPWIPARPDYNPLLYLPPPAPLLCPSHTQHACLQNPSLRSLNHIPFLGISHLCSCF